MSRINFKETATKVTTLSPLMSGREKLETEDIEGEILTPIAVDIAVMSGTGFPVFVFAEHPDHYYNGGLVLKKIADAWIDAYDGDPEACSADLDAERDVHIRIKKGMTRDRSKNIVNVEIL